MDPNIVTEKTSKAVVTIVSRKPAVAIVLAMIASFTFLMWSHQELQHFFLELFNQQTLPLFGLVIVVSMMYLSHATRVNLLEGEVIFHEAQTHLCRREQSIMRSTIFKVALAVAHDAAERAVVTKLIYELDVELASAAEKAKETFTKRNGGPVPGGNRATDPPLF